MRTEPMLVFRNTKGKDINKFREFWIRTPDGHFQYGTVTENYPNFLDSIHVIEIAAVEQLKAELERERMRLVACGVIALSNTTETLEQAINMHDDYKSASARDVERTVRTEIRQRAEITALKSRLAKAKTALEFYASLADRLSVEYSYLDGTFAFNVVSDDRFATLAKKSLSELGEG